MIDVDFQHLRYIISDSDLTAYGSPHYNKLAAGKALCNSLEHNVKLIKRMSLQFNEAQILCGNEAFPESAIADPLADLEVWDEWRTGFRSFPYPGKYSRLNILTQEAKTGSTSSIGVIGEIMTGLFAQAGISPWILVRVIRKWPDFIFYCDDSTYAFVESKAFTNKDSNSNGLGNRVPNNKLSECLRDAVQQINADPFVTVWGAFTEIVDIDPMRFNVTFLEIQADSNRRTSLSNRYLPDAVKEGISEQAVSIAISLADERILSDLRERKNSRSRTQAEEKVVQLAKEHIESILLEAGPDIAVSASRKDIDRIIRQTVSDFKVGEDIGGKRLRKVLSVSDNGLGRDFLNIVETQDKFKDVKFPDLKISRLRKIGESSVVVTQLPEDDRYKITNNYESNWEDACKPYTTFRGINLYRCGGLLVGID